MFLSERLCGKFTLGNCGRCQLVARRPELAKPSLPTLLSFLLCFQHGALGPQSHKSSPRVRVPPYDRFRTLRGETVSNNFQGANGCQRFVEHTNKQTNQDPKPRVPEQTAASTHRLTRQIAASYANCEVTHKMAQKTQKSLRAASCTRSAEQKPAPTHPCSPLQRH